METGLFSALIPQAGVFEYGYVEPSAVGYHDSVRAICRQNVCQNYNTTWACPPAVGTIEACKARCLHYNTMLLFTAKYGLEDSFDFEGMQTGMRAFKKVAYRLEGLLKPYLGDYLVLTNEGCDNCVECTYPDAECRYPDKLHHTIEGYGFIVGELANKAGVKYNNGPNTVTYFGALLFNSFEVDAGALL